MDSAKRSTWENISKIASSDPITYTWNMASSLDNTNILYFLCIYGWDEYSDFCH